MADLEFVDPATGASLGAQAFGRVAIGTDSAQKALRLRYRWGQSGSGLQSNALVLEYSTNGGSTWASDLALFKIEVTGIANPGSDPAFLGAPMAARRTNRLELPPLRAGCAYDLAVAFSHPYVTGPATTAYLWRMGVEVNEASRRVALVPDSPSGVHSGIGVPDVSEWIAAPTLAPGADKVTLGDSSYVHLGLRHEEAGGDVALDQTDGDAATLSTGEEYIALLSAGASGITTTKGSKATAGTAVAPSYPAGELPLAVVRVPYGGAIATYTLVALSGRCLVADAGGLEVTIQPGRVSLPGWLVTPRAVQTLTLPDDATSVVRMGATGAVSLLDGAPLAEVVTAAGDIVSVTDRRRLLGLEPIRLSIRGTETTGTARAAAYVPFPWALDSAEASLRVAAAGATGSTDLDVDLGGDEIASGAIGAGATSAALVLGTTYGEPGWVTVDVVGTTSGGTQGEDLEIVLWLARRG